MENVSKELSYREQCVVEMFMLVFEMIHKKYKLEYAEIAKISKETGLCGYIEASFEILNSTGNTGVLEDIEEYIRDMGGKLE